MEDTRLFWWLYAPFAVAIAVAGVLAAAAPGWAVRGSLLLASGVVNLATAARGVYRDVRTSRFEPGLPTAAGFCFTILVLASFAVTSA